MKVYPILLLGFSGLALPTAAIAQPFSHPLVEGQVESVLGGDNLLIQLNGETLNVDLANIWPDSEWEGLAEQRLTDLLPPGTPVMVQPAWGWNGQLFGYVYSPQGLVNTQLIREGLSLPRQDPESVTLQEAYIQARREAQANGSGYWQTQAETVQSSTESSPFSLAALMSAVPGRAVQWGMGTVAIAATLAAASQLWKHWQQQPKRLRRKQFSQLQQHLTQVVTQQNVLERQHRLKLKDVSDWQERARTALNNSDTEQAKAALTQAQQHKEAALVLQQQLETVQMKVVGLQSQINELNGKIQFPQFNENTPEFGPKIDASD
jgi:endonuclease YncB( thermonuclease family)